MGTVGLPEMVTIFVIALVLFGPKKLPELGRTLGKALREFRRAKNELTQTLQSHLDELDRETRQQSSSSVTTTSTAPWQARYSYPYEEYRYDPENPLMTNGVSGSQISTPQIEAPEEEHVAASASVNGTVPRTNGVPSVEPVTVAPDEQHPV